jgi:hypothetical protein
VISPRQGCKQHRIPPVAAGATDAPKPIKRNLASVAFGLWAMSWLYLSLWWTPLAGVEDIKTHKIYVASPA